MSILFEAIRHELLSLAHRPCNPAPDYSFAQCVQTRIMERAGCVPHWTRSTIYTLSTHYLHTIYTLSTHYLHTIYHYSNSIHTLEVPEGGAACVRQLEHAGAVQPRGARGGQAGQAPAHQGHRLRDALLLHGVQGNAVTPILCSVIFQLYFDHTTQTKVKCSR